MMEGIKIGNKSSLKVHEVNQERFSSKYRSGPSISTFEKKSQEVNPYDVNLLDKKGKPFVSNLI